MPTLQTKLSGSDRAYTKQDIIDGKCRPNGTPWGPGEGPSASKKGATPSPEPVPTQSAETPTPETTAAPDTGPDTVADAAPDGGEATTAENVNVDNPDSEKSTDNP